MPIPIWISKYGTMPAAMKDVTKVLWVIKESVRPADQDRVARDILLSAFKTEQEFKDHVTIVFTFCDKNDMADQGHEWIADLMNPVADSAQMAAG